MKNLQKQLYLKQTAWILRLNQCPGLNDNKPTFIFYFKNLYRSMPFRYNVCLWAKLKGHLMESLYCLGKPQKK